MSEERTFIEVFNEIGKKYVEAGITNIYVDYHFLQLIQHLSEDINDKVIRDKIDNLIESLKKEVENKKVKP